MQKQRATRSEDALEQLNAQVLEREQGLLDLRAEHDRLQTNHDKLLKERAKLDKENADMRRYDVTVTVSVPWCEERARQQSKLYIVHVYCN